ncbi:AAA family ATPase [Candidatus Woesearchaeota archaeon]|nr:AAA family ATPase [Candidatus Woesearchaeota archaeon]
MERKGEVSLEAIVWKADPKEFSFTSTAEIQPPANPIDIVKGQDDAKEALSLAIRLRQNAILIGPAGCGKSLLAKTVAEQFSLQNVNKIKLYDQLLVHNFENEFEPEVLILPTPMGKEFASDFKLFMRHIRDGVEYAFPGRKQNPLETIIRFSKKTFLTTKTYIGPLKYVLDGAADQTGYKIVDNVQDVLRQSMRGVLDTPVLADGQKMQTLRQVYSGCDFDEPARNTAWKSHMLDGIVHKYQSYPKVIRYIEEMAKEAQENDMNTSKPLFDVEPGHIKKLRDEKYMVNVVVNNMERTGVPVEYIENPSLQNIIGEAGHDPYNLRPMHMRAKAGKLHHGNGGIVIIDELITVLQDTAMRNFLLTVLNDKKARIGGGYGLAGGGTSAGVETKPLDADCIVIGCANKDIFQYMTDKIARRFQHKVRFQAAMDNTPKNRQAYAEFIAYEINKYNSDQSNQEKLVHYSPDGVAAVVEWGVRFAQNTAHGKQKLTNILDPVGLLVKTASMMAVKDGAQLVGEHHVDIAREEIRRLSSQLQKDYLTYINEGLISIKSQGQEVSSVNGLVVIHDDFGMMSYGFPSRLIATASIGKGGFQNTEKEAGLAGKIMSKAHEIVRNYFNRIYQQYLVDTVTLSVSHAQSYSDMDGDSASIASTIALKSALSGYPVEQSLAMTGSMNELGDVQPIGGVNEKIEGFYSVCKQRGLTGTQGVIIPEGNVQDLMLRKEVVSDVQAGRFHIYQVSHIDDAVELVFGRLAQEIDTTIQSKLQKYWEDHHDRRP